MLTTWFKQLFEGANGEADEMATLAIAGFAVMLAGTIHNVFVLKLPFDVAAFGQGYGVALGAAAAGMGLKRKLETPQP